MLRCAFCHGSALWTDRPCAGCRTVLHADCWDLAERCPTLGCGRSWAWIGDRRRVRTSDWLAPLTRDLGLLMLTVCGPFLLVVVAYLAAAVEHLLLR